MILLLNGHQNFINYSITCSTVKKASAEAFKNKRKYDLYAFLVT